jgi:hypothetical protein
VEQDAIECHDRPKARLGSRIADRFAGIGLDADVPELRGQAPRPAELDS